MFTTNTSLNAGMWATVFATMIATTMPEAEASEGCSSVGVGIIEMQPVVHSTVRIEALQDLLGVAYTLVEANGEKGIVLETNVDQLRLTVDELIANDAVYDLGISPEMLEMLKDAFDDPIVLDMLEYYEHDWTGAIISAQNALMELDALSARLSHLVHDQMVGISGEEIVIVLLIVAVIAAAGYGASQWGKYYSPWGDFDQDNIPNYQDNDIDGDGTNNSKDADAWDPKVHCFPRPFPGFFSHLTAQPVVRYDFLQVRFVNLTYVP